MGVYLYFHICKFLEKNTWSGGGQEHFFPKVYFEELTEIKSKSTHLHVSQFKLLERADAFV